MRVTIKKSKKDGKKYTAVFYDNNNKKVKTTHFGAEGMSDFTKHKDTKRRTRYLSRHRKREKWNKYMTAGSLSRWILWNKPTLRGSIEDYKKKFNLK
jgi:hypothetical protein